MIQKLDKKGQAEKRLIELKRAIENENISYGEIAELQSLAKYIDKNDVLLLEWAGICEFCKKKDCDCAGVSN
jgi:hypothetical protein